MTVDMSVLEELYSHCNSAILKKVYTLYFMDPTIGNSQ